MDIRDLKPRWGEDTYRIGDSDDLVLMENLGNIPTGSVCLQDYGIIVLCTAGKAQFEYDGAVIQLQKNDMLLILNHCIICNFLSSPTLPSVSFTSNLISFDIFILLS